MRSSPNAAGVRWMVALSSPRLLAKAQPGAQAMEGQHYRSPALPGRQFDDRVREPHCRHSGRASTEPFPRTSPQRARRNRRCRCLGRPAAHRRVRFRPRSHYRRARRCLPGVLKSRDTRNPATPMAEGAFLPQADWKWGSLILPARPLSRHIQVRGRSVRRAR